MVFDEKRVCSIVFGLYCFIGHCGRSAFDTLLFLLLFSTSTTESFKCIIFNREKIATIFSIFLALARVEKLCYTCPFLLRDLEQTTRDFAEKDMLKFCWVFKQADWHFPCQCYARRRTTFGKL